MAAADRKRGHRFRTNLTNRATRQGEAGSSTAGAIRAVGEEVASPASPPPCFIIHGDPDARYHDTAP